jgi:hypothetical protein
MINSIVKYAKKRWSQLNSKKGRWTALLVLGIVVVLLLAPDVAMAEEATSELDKIKAGLAGTALTMKAFLQVLLYPLLLLMSALMDSSILVGPEMENILLSIWVDIRNWVNIAMVLVLVGVAIYNVTGLAEEGSNYGLKAILPKVVIALIAVNFSFLGLKVMIDATSVLTSAVYALPVDLIQWDEQKAEVEIRLCSIPTTTNPVEVSGIRKLSEASTFSVIFCEKDDTISEEDEAKYTGEFNDMGKSYFSNFGEHNVATIMMVNMGSLLEQDNIPTNTGSIDALAEISLNALFSITMFVMFGFAYVAMIIVLIARLVVLWVCLALSPIMVLFFVFPDLSSVGGGQLDLKDQFFKHLFVPVILGIVFSIGFVMINALKETSSGGWLGQIGGIQLEDFKDPNLSDDVNQLVSTFGEGITGFQSILVMICIVLVIWIGVFAAADQTVASSFTGSIKTAGQEFGKYVAGAPLYATAIPIPNADGKTESVPLASLLALPGALGQERRQSTSKGVTNLKAALGIGNAAFDKTKDQAVRDMKSTDHTGKADKLDQFLQVKGAKDSGQLRSMIADYALNSPNRKAIETELAKIEKEGDIFAALKTGKLGTEVFQNETPPDKGKWNTVDPGGSSPSATPSTGSEAPADTGVPDSQRAAAALTAGKAAGLKGRESATRQAVISGLSRDTAATVEVVFDDGAAVNPAALAAFSGTTMSLTQKEEILKQVRTSVVGEGTDQRTVMTAASFNTAVDNATGGTGEAAPAGPPVDPTPPADPPEDPPAAVPPGTPPGE